MDFTSTNELNNLQENNNVSEEITFEEINNYYDLSNIDNDNDNDNNAINNNAVNDNNNNNNNNNNSKLNTSLIDKIKMNSKFGQNAFLLIEYITKYDKMPLSNETYKGCYIGRWLNGIKYGIITKNDTAYKFFAQHKIIKNVFDAYLEKTKISSVQYMCDIIIEFIDKNKRMPYPYEIYKNITLIPWIKKYMIYIKNMCEISKTHDINNPYSKLLQNNYFYEYYDKHKNNCRNINIYRYSKF